MLSVALNASLKAPVCLSDVSYGPAEAEGVIKTGESAGATPATEGTMPRARVDGSWEVRAISELQSTSPVNKYPNTVPR